MANLQSLITKRTTIKAALTRHQKVIDEFKLGDDTTILDKRQPNINELFTNYNSVQSEIEELEYTNLNIDLDEASSELDALNEKFNKERERVEIQYYDILAKIAHFLADKQNLNKNSNGQPLTSRVINMQKTTNSEYSGFLKPLSLPSFSGKHSNWYAFIDSFNSLVHNDNYLSDIKKFHYLRGCLKDDAFRAIESLSVSSDNYICALELLKKRFENKRLIVQEHINSILFMPQISKSSHVELRQLLDTVNNNLAALKTLNLPVDSWDHLLIPIICEKLDFHSKREWQLKLEKDLPKYADFNNFLEKRYQTLEAMSFTKNLSKHISSAPKNQKCNSFNRPQNHAMVVTKNNCTLCKKSQHNLFQCNSFLNLSTADRLAHVEKLKLCQNCLRQNHTTDKCKVTFSCKECNQRHHTLLHITEFVPTPNVSTFLIKTSNQTILSTAIVLITDKFGNFYNCRVLLDQCSEANIITADMCKKLKLTVNQINTCITGVNLSDHNISQATNVTIKSKISEFATNFDCLVVDKITRPIPSVSFDNSLIEIPPHITLADPRYNISQEIDLLLGANLYWQLLEGGPIQVKSNQPYLQQSKLGWIIGGKLDLANKKSLACNLTTISQIDSDLSKQVQQFWNQEEVVDNIILSKDEMECENHFRENTKRAENGKFIVSLPFKNVPRLGNSRDTALKQFLSLEQRLGKNPALKSEYINFMDEYLNLKHMELVSKVQVDNPNSYYMPHHPVYKQTVNGLKLRVVFNASARGSNNISLNDILMTGPTVQQHLFSILARFRTFQIALSADITQMYRMILVNQADRDFQRILWRNNPNKPIQTYRLNTLTYGETCAPFLAVRCLNQLALESKEKYPVASIIIPRDFYMDDLLSGANTLKEAIIIQNQLREVLSLGGFNLCKWASNETKLIPCESTKTSIHFNKTGDVKVLGFIWNCENDELKYQVNNQNIAEIKKITKRNILSAVARIFDPLGLINPTIVKAKILLQHIWTLKVDWDEILPIDIQEFWTKFLKELEDLNYFRIPRKLIPIFPVSLVEIHGFADASIRAYGAVIYLKTVDKTGKSYINLICSKSRVAPLKVITLPRLELNAAVLLAKLTANIMKILNLKITSKHYWTDSTIVLSWLSESSSQWKQYVSSRVSQIHSVSSRDEWHHVRSGDNPADIVSRGMFPRQLHNSKLWWHGPNWLIKDSNNWPKLNSADLFDIENSINFERKPTIKINTVSCIQELPVITRFSSFHKLQRVFAYCLRFIHNCRHKSKLNNLLSYEEFYTLLTCIEACLNSRPISPLSSDANDLEPLTPGHFLIGAPLTAPIESDLRAVQYNRLSRWQRIQQLQQHFWARWYKDYLSQLQLRPKGGDQQYTNISVGDLVVLVEDNLPPLKWQLGRVIETHPGSDGVVRVVTVKTKKGVYKRAIKKVCKIPVGDD